MKMMVMFMTVREVLVVREKSRVNSGDIDLGWGVPLYTL